MAEPADEVGEEEILARFILVKKHVRADKTIRRAAFIPNPHDELSVTRRGELPIAKVGEIGQGVATARGLPLIGGANVTARKVREQDLKTVPAPLDANPYHANIVGWPDDLDDRKPLAEELANSAGTLEEFP